MIRIVVYTRQQCPLCDQALEDLERFKSEFPHEVTQVDIESDAILFEHYHEQIPVIKIGPYTLRPPYTETDLRVSYAQYRTIRGQMLRTVPSQFLFELGCGFDEEPEEDESEHHAFERSRPTVPEFSTGELVQHKEFGLGRVEKFIDIGDSSVVVVNFNTGQRKSLMVRFAGLSKVRDPK